MHFFVVIFCPADEKNEGELGSPKMVTAYRSIAARFNYLALDRTDIQFAVRRCCKAMSKPQKCDWDRLRHIGRYLIGRPGFVTVYRWQQSPDKLTVHVDSD